MKMYFFLILTLIFYFQTHSVYGIEKEIQSNNKELVQFLQNYWQWWGNSPEDSPDNNPKCSIHIDTNNSIVFLQNPFETGNISYDCTENPIPSGYLIFFPLLSSWCSQGDVGLFDKSYNELKNCAFNPGNILWCLPVSGTQSHLRELQKTANNDDYAKSHY